MSPKFAVAESADLAQALKLAGFNLLTDLTSAREVAEAVRASNLSPRELIVVTPANTPLLVAWVQSLAASNRLVVVIGDNAPIPRTAQVKLPCKVNDILAVCRAPLSGSYGEWVLGEDLTITEMGVHEELDQGSMFDSLAGDWDRTPSPVSEPPRYTDPVEDEPAPPGRRVVFDEAPDEPEPAIPSRVAPSIPQPLGPRPAAVPAAIQPSVPQPSVPPVTHPGQSDAHPSTPQPSVPASFFRDPDPQPERRPYPPSQSPASAGDVYSPTSPATVYRPPEPDVPHWPGAVDADTIDFPPIVGQTPLPQQQSSATMQPADAGPCPLILVAAAKGGVGKTAFALMLAERAASAGVRRVILVDGNRGQGDVGKYLRITKPLPSIYDAAVQNNPRGAIISPKMLNSARDPRLPQLSFGMVMAPRAGQVDSTVVSSSMYAQVVEEARDVAELVIVDTQITEEEDTSGLWDEVWLPLMRSGGWCVALASDSTPAVQNMRDRLAQWAGDGVGVDRMLIALNDVSAETMLDIGQVEMMLARQADVVGVVPRLDEVKQAFQVGRLPVDVPQVTAVTDAVLLRATGNPAFSPVEGVPERAGFLASLFGRGRR